MSADRALVRAIEIISEATVRVTVYVRLPSPDAESARIYCAIAGSPEHERIEQDPFYAMAGVYDAPPGYRQLEGDVREATEALRADLRSRAVR